MDLLRSDHYQTKTFLSSLNSRLCPVQAAWKGDTKTKRCLAGPVGPLQVEDPSLNQRSSSQHVFTNFSNTNLRNVLQYLFWFFSKAQNWENVPFLTNKKFVLFFFGGKIRRFIFTKLVKKWCELDRHRTWEMLWVEKMWMRWQWTWMARVDLDLLPGTKLICLRSTWLVANPMSLWFRMPLILWTLPPLLDLLKTINGMISFDVLAWYWQGPCQSRVYGCLALVILKIGLSSTRNCGQILLSLLSV